MSLERDGFAVVRGVIDAARVEALRAVLGGETHAQRNLLDIGEVREMALALRPIMASYLGAECFAVRGTLFDKIADANWHVPWHQDLTILVRERRDFEGFGPWTVKAGRIAVQPPVEVLEQMLAVRVHLDDCPPENGALRLVAGSHRLGRVNGRPDGEVVTPHLSAGDALLMRPLAVHASSPSASASHRRVIHIEFAAHDLPGGLEWFDRVGPTLEV